MKTKIVLVSLVNPSKLAYSDLTWNFPVKYASGKQYVFLLCDYDSNIIFVRHLRSRRGTAIVAIYDSIHAHLYTKSITP